LLSITTGGSNTVIGATAGDALTDGTNNTFMGIGAGGTTTSVGYSVAIGMEAMNASNVTSGANHTIAIGTNALNALTSASGNIAIGYETLLGHTTGARNIALGWKAMNDTDANDCPTSTDNIMIGYDAGGGTWTTNDSNYNVGIGNYVMDSALNGIVACTAVGHLALSSVTTNTGTGGGGSYNTAFGYQALRDNLTGEGNVAIGGNAGMTQTTGEKNVFVGGSAGSDWDGDKNVAIGSAAMSGVGAPTGDYNVAVGYQAMKGATAALTGDNNTAIGKDAALILQGAAANNTFVGATAGDAFTTGSNNVIIGFNAGSHNVDTTTGIKNVLIGNYSDTSAADSDNQIAIGYDCSGQADNSVTLGNADVTAVYMADDSGATVHCARSVNKANSAGALNNIEISGDNGSSDGGSGLVLQYNDTMKWKILQRNQTSIGSAFALQILDAGSDDGVYINQGGSGWTDASDERLKTSIAPIENAVDKLNTLQAVNFKWKYGSEERQAKNNIGLLAQEVYEVFPEAVDHHDLDDFELIDHPTIEGTKQAQGAWGIDKSKLIPVLVKAVQELSAKVEELEAKLK